MSGAGNRGWDARTIFSDDPLGCEDVPPRRRDQRKIHVPQCTQNINQCETNQRDRPRGSVDDPPDHPDDRDHQRGGACPAGQEFDACFGPFRRQKAPTRQ